MPIDDITIVKINCNTFIFAFNSIHLLGIRGFMIFANVPRH